MPWASRRYWARCGAVGGPAPPQYLGLIRERLQTPHRRTHEVTELLRGAGEGPRWRVPRTLADLNQILRLLLEVPEDAPSDPVTMFRSLMVLGYFQRLEDAGWPYPAQTTFTLTEGEEADSPYVRAVQTALAFTVNRLPWWLWLQEEPSSPRQAEARESLSVAALAARRPQWSPEVLGLQGLSAVYDWYISHAVRELALAPPHDPAINMLRATGIGPSSADVDANPYRSLRAGVPFAAFPDVNARLERWWFLVHDTLLEMVRGRWSADTGAVLKPAYGVLVVDHPPGGITVTEGEFDTLRVFQPTQFPLRDVGQILAFFVYDPSVLIYRLYQTELRPSYKASYELWLVDHVSQDTPVDEVAREALFDWLQEYTANSESHEDRPAAVINALPRVLPVEQPLRAGRLGFVGAYKESLDDVVGELHANRLV